jgi:hypothetical protein
MRKIFGIGLALALGACATQRPSLLTRPIETAAPPPPHLAAIFGHGAYRTPAGMHGSCAGQSVALMHETVSFRRRIVALYGSSEHALLPVAEVQSRSAKLGPSTENPLVESAQCGADGGFSFHNLQPGSYFIIARTHQGRATLAEQYVAMERVVLNEGEYRDLNLAP